jgi:hypothetical protein
MDSGFGRKGYRTVSQAAPALSAGCWAKNCPISFAGLAWGWLKTLTAPNACTPARGMSRWGIRQEPAFRRDDACVAEAALVARGNSLEAALQLGEEEMGAPAKSWPAAHHPAKVAYPRVGLSAWLQLRETPAPRCDPNELGEGSAGFPHLSGCDIIAAAKLS